MDHLIHEQRNAGSTTNLYCLLLIIYYLFLFHWGTAHTVIKNIYILNCLAIQT